MSRYWSDLVNTLTPYVPGEQPDVDEFIKLNTNENPYPPSPAVLAALQSANLDDLRRYPDPESLELVRGFASRAGLSNDQVFIGNGSDEVLAFAFMGLLKQSLPLYFPDVTYSFYPVWSDLCGIEYKTVQLTDDWRVSPEDFPVNNGGIIFPNPNAPTGIAMSLQGIKELLERSRDSVVVVDEAYIDFGGDSAVSLINQFDNLLVIQTLSKSRSLAGLRVGVAFGNADLIEALNRVKNSFNSYPLDRLAQRCAISALEDEVYFEETVGKIISTRDRLTSRLQDMAFEVLPSSANFLFVQHSQIQGSELYAALRKEGVLVRYFAGGRTDNFLRISVGTDAESDALLEALAKITGS
jgi:histidinol-phosphate aminotransferase